MLPEVQSYIQELNDRLSLAKFRCEQKDQPLNIVGYEMQQRRFISAERGNFLAGIYNQLTKEQQFSIANFFYEKDHGKPFVPAKKEELPPFPVDFGQGEKDVFQELLKKLEEYATDEMYQSAMDAARKKSARHTNYTDVSHPLAEKAEALLKELPFGAKGHIEIRRDIEEAVSLIQYDPYAEEHGEIVNPITQGTYAECMKKMEKTLATMEDREYASLFTRESHHNIFTVPPMKDKETWSRFRKTPRFQISPELQHIYTEIFKKMEEIGLADNKSAVSAEQGKKVYAFKNFREAQQAVVEAITRGEAKDLDELSDLTANYKEEYRKMKELYELGSKLIANEYGHLPDNVDNQREPSIPPEFKSNLRVNSCLNSIYLTYNFLKTNDIPLDQFFNNPLQAMYEYVEKPLAQQGFDACVQGLPIGIALAQMSNTKPAYSFSEMQKATCRPLEGFTTMEYDETNASLNGLEAVLFENYTVAIINDLTLPGRYVDQYLDRAAPAIFLLPEEDIDLRSLASHNEAIIDPKTMTASPRFHFDEYLLSHDVDFDVLNNRIKSVMTSYLRAGGNKSGYVPLVQGAVECATKAILVKQPNMKSTAVQELLTLCENPTAYFSDVAIKEDIKSLPARVTPAKTFKAAQKEFQKAQKQHDKDRKKFLKDEKKYNKQAEKLQKAIAKLQKKCDKELYPAKIAAARRELDEKTQSLATLKASKLEALKTAANSGLITATYYEQRKKDVERNRQYRTPSMYVKGLCDKKTFLKEKMDGFTTKAEVIAEYNALKAQEKSAQAAHDFKMLQHWQFHKEVLALDTPQAPRTRVGAPVERTQISLTDVQQEVVPEAAQLSVEPPIAETPTLETPSTETKERFELPKELVSDTEIDDELEEEIEEDEVEEDAPDISEYKEEYDEFIY